MSRTGDAQIPGHARGYDGFGGDVRRVMGDSRPWWPPTPTAPPGAPNVIVVLIDDMGFADIGPFGSEIDTPTLDRLAAGGMRLTNYHTAPVCSPARAALLTGLNPHRAGFSTVAGFDPGFPGTILELADDVLTVPEILQGAGYSTFALGKWHLTREGLTHDGASKKSWPTQRGFDRYYGCMEGFTPFMAPNRLVRDNSPVQVDRYPDDYYLTDDLTDEAIGMIRSLRAHDATRPFFMYFAHHAMHAPFAAKQADIAKYRGRYDRGWDAVREERFARQLAAGLFPPDTRLPGRNAEGPAHDVPAWEDIPAAEREKCARIMEVYAAMVDNLDQNLARLLAAVDDYGELDNTLVIVTSDNGGANDGGRLGTRNFFANFLFGLPVPPEWDRDPDLDLDLLGSAQTMPQYPRGWAMSSNTPFRLYKGSTFAGGVRTPFLAHWPAGLPRRPEDDGIRPQYAYVSDIASTVLEAVGVERPTHRHGHEAKSVDGVSFLPVLHDPEHPATHVQQYSEWNGHRGLYRDGWKLLTLHKPGTPFDDSEWQLFDVRTDPTETTNVAADHPGLVRELAAEWEREAWANTVFPLNEGKGHMQHVQRPSSDALAEAVTLFPGTPQLERGRSARLIQLHSFAIELRLDARPGDEGVLVAHGDQGGGYVVFVEDGQVHLHYNEYGKLHAVLGPVLQPGPQTVLLEATWRPAYKWSFELSSDGSAGTGRLEDVAMMLQLAPFTGIDVGTDRGGPVSWPMHEAHGAFPFSGELISVTYRPGESAEYDPEPHFRAYRDAAAAYD